MTNLNILEKISLVKDYQVWLFKVKRVKYLQTEGVLKLEIFTKSATFALFMWWEASSFVEFILSGTAAKDRVVLKIKYGSFSSWIRS